MAARERQIAFLDPTFRERGADDASRVGVQRERHRTARPPIETMERMHAPADGVPHRTHQVVLVVRPASMDDDAGRLVDDDAVIVPVQDRRRSRHERERPADPRRPLRWYVSDPMAASRTAQYVAAYRAIESLERHPHFHDGFAVSFLSPELERLVRAARVSPFRALVKRYADRRAPGARTSAIARTCYIDDALRSAVRAGTRQVVVLGAGFDCRAHRLPELRDSVVFEVDRAETQAVKRAALARAVSSARDDVRYVAVDFLRDPVSDRLVEAGWDSAAPTSFVWEGVTNYLTEPAVISVLAWIGRSAVGSTVAFTYVHRGLLDRTQRFEGGDKILANVQRLAEPWTFGLYPDDVAPFLARAGLDLVEDLGADDYRRRYLDGSARTLRGYAFYRLALAKRRPG
jgi:methyltransferase (TIGR00027 family)